MDRARRSRKVHDAQFMCAICVASQVGCTALGVESPLLAKHTFDVAIVDEAGQMTLPAAIAPLLKARAFVLVWPSNPLPLYNVSQG